MRIASAAAPLRILLIAADRGDAEAIRHALDEAMPARHATAIARTLQHGLARLEQAAFDIVLLDCGLTEGALPGWLHLLRHSRPELPVLLFGRAAGFGGAARRGGAEDYLPLTGLDGHAIGRAIQYALLRRAFSGIAIPQSNHDRLTGLADRRSFDSRMQMARARARRNGGGFALLLLDIDGFAAINAALGDAAGDELLRQFAARLQAALPPKQCLARLHGDDFAILIEDLPEIAAAERIAEAVAGEIGRLLGNPFPLGERSIAVAASIGIAFHAAGQDIACDALLKQADAAMHDAKLKPGTFHRSYPAMLSNLILASGEEEALPDHPDDHPDDHPPCRYPSAATPGRVLPSIHSRNAPPALER